MSRCISVLGWYLDTDEDGEEVIVLVQSDDENGEVEHEARDGDELWAAFQAIAAETGLARREVVEGEILADHVDADELPRPRTITDAIMNVAHRVVTNAVGPVLAPVADVAIRNHGRDLVRGLRSASGRRKGRPTRR